MKNESVSGHANLTAGELIALTVFNSGISLTGTISNILLILAFLMNRQLRQNHTAILLINLSFFDLIICAVYVPMNICSINDNRFEFEPAKSRLGFGLFIGSLNGELCVTLDRFISVCFPYWYLAWITNMRVATLVSVSWFVVILLTVTLFTNHHYTFLYITFLLILILSFHVAMYLFARREAKKIASQYPPECRKFPFWDKSTKVVAMTVVASLLCWAPMAILTAVVRPSSPSFERFHRFSLAFTSLSGVIDPFIFCWRLSDFRSALYACLRKARRMACKNMT